MPGVSNAQFTSRDVVDAVVRLLAEESGEPEAEIRMSLEEAGLELPIDSLLIVEILTRVEEEFHVRIPADADAARSMRSVWAFAETVVTAARAMEGSDDHGNNA